MDGFIFFKFASDAQRDRIPCTAAEMLVSDLKCLISEKKQIPRWDLVLSNEDTGVEYEKASDLVPKNTSIVVRRTPLLCKKKQEAIVSIAQRAAEEPIRPVEEDKGVTIEVIHGRPFPPEYLCPLCVKPFDDPLIRTCCGKSACKSCLENVRQCPMCKTRDACQIPNLRLAESVKGLDRRFYYLPGEDPSPVYSFVNTGGETEIKVVKEEESRQYGLISGGSSSSVSLADLLPPSTLVLPRPEVPPGSDSKTIPKRTTNVEEILSDEEKRPKETRKKKRRRKRDRSNDIVEVIDAESGVDATAAALRAWQKHAWLAYWEKQKIKQAKTEEEPEPECVLT